MMMTRLPLMSRLRSLGLAWGLGAALVLGGCSSVPSLNPFKSSAGPALKPVAPQWGIQKAWTVQMGAFKGHLSAWSNGSQVALASTDGQFRLIEASTGRVITQLKLGESLQAGVGGDGQRFAVITQSNQLLAIEDGKVVWRYKFNAVSQTPPLVAGQRVFVLTADRTVTALDGASGQKLWSQQRPAEPLVLNQAGLLVAVGDTLVAGIGGRVVGFNPNSGLSRWDVLVGSTRGANEVERLVDVVAQASRQGNQLCVRSFQVALGCLDADKGQLQWTRNAQGYTGLDGDDQKIYGTESDGKVLAWDRATGQPAWTHEELRSRVLTSPLVLGRSVVVGDQFGELHFLSRQDGQPINRIGTDGSPIAMRPIAVGNVLVAVTQKGQVMGFQPE